MRRYHHIILIGAGSLLLAVSSCADKKSAREQSRIARQAKQDSLAAKEREAAWRDSMAMVDEIHDAMVADSIRRLQAATTRVADSMVAAQERRDPPDLPVEPSFRGGREAMDEFIRRHMYYPMQAKQRGITGTVYVDVVVTKEGKLKDAKIREGLGYGLDEEALRLVKLMPNWEPGLQDRRPVEMQYTIPIQFGGN